MSAHLTDHELIERLYGVAEAGDHLGACESCATRLEAMRERRSSLAAAPTVAPEFFANQQARILARIERPERSYRWVPALAAACLAIAGFFVYYPNRTPVVPPHSQAQVHVVEPTDAQLYAEVYSLQESMEPRAASPIHALFQEQE